MSNIYTKLQYNNKESPMYVPNEIFGDFIGGAIKQKHVPFAYSYYYLVSWLYRNCKYGSLPIDNKQIKELLGYSPTYVEVDYLIKKNGVLDVIGYTLTEKDYPISWSLEGNDLEFTMLSDLDDDMQKIAKDNRSRKYFVKFPVKGFYRDDEEDCYNGTFYEIDNTHEVPFEVFMFCMEKEDVGCTGFYLWCYLKMQDQIYKGYDISVDDLADEVGIARRTLAQYLKVLRQYNMIDCKHNQDFFCVALKNDERKANTYYANDWTIFSRMKIDMKKIQYKSKKAYLEGLKVESKVDFDALFG